MTLTTHLLPVWASCDDLGVAYAVAFPQTPVGPKCQELTLTTPCAIDWRSDLKNNQQRTSRAERPLFFCFLVVFFWAEGREEE